MARTVLRLLVKPRSRAASKRHWNPHGDPPSFAILNQRPADLPGEAADCKARETLIDLPWQAQRLLTLTPSVANSRPVGLSRASHGIERVIGNLKPTAPSPARMSSSPQASLVAAAPYRIKFTHAA
jgi:hypothetical protein